MTGAEVLVAIAIAVGIVGVIVPVLPGSLLVLGAILVWALEVGTAIGWAVFAVATAFIDGMLPSCQLTSTTVSAPARISSVQTSSSSASNVSRRNVTEPG